MSFVCDRISAAVTLDESGSIFPKALPQHVEVANAAASASPLVTPNSLDKTIQDRPLRRRRQQPSASAFRHGSNQRTYERWDFNCELTN
jgi:hypothetical protein